MSKAENLAGLLDANGDVLATNLDNVSVAFADVTSKPTTLSGYGITDAATSTQGTNADTAYGWGDHSTQSYATTTYVDTAVSGLVDSAPATLDTLNELAAALGDDANFSTTVTNSIATKAALSGADFTGGVTTTGNLLVGTTTSEGASGVTLKSDGGIYASRAGTHFLNRETTDGDILRFQKSGSTVGSIGTNGGRIQIDSGVNSAGVHFAGGALLPTYNQALDSADQIDLGNSTYRWKDLYLSGGIRNPSGDLQFYTSGGEDMRLETDGDLHVDGDVIAYSSTISDIRLKDNIVGINNALAKVGQLNGYTFEYKADGKVSAGVIAQEVEAVLPEAVCEKQLPLKTDDDQEYKVVNYDALHGLLIEAIKELADRVEALEAK